MPEKNEFNVKNMTLSQIENNSKNQKFNQDFMHALACDPRAGAKKIYKRLLREENKRQEKGAILHTLFEPEEEVWKQGLSYVAGVDEAGRGPLAGPVVAAAVIFPGFVEILDLRDSKKLSPVMRGKLAVEIKKAALDWSVGLATVSEILCYNIHWASILAMKRAVDDLEITPEYILVDGFAIKDLHIPQKPLVGGDEICASIAAASVIAKVMRDDLMKVLHLRYPHYGFNNHKGYGTKEHLEALEHYGPCSVHRRDFTPVKRALLKQKKRAFRGKLQK